MSTAPAANDPGLVHATEYTFFSYWYHAAWRGAPVALEVVHRMPPEVLTREYFREAYTYLGHLLAKGERIDTLAVDKYLLDLSAKVGGGATDHAAQDAAFGSDASDEDVLTYARKLLTIHRGRSQADLLIGALNQTHEALALGDGTKKVADALIDRLMTLHSRAGENGGPQTQTEIVDYLLERVNKDKPSGYNWPWPRLQHVLGVIAPGKVYGFTAYSGAGKTLLMCNLFRELVIRGVPVIVFPTEMDLQWLERAVATMARVPKEFAEEGDWRDSTPEDMRRYREAMRSFVGLQWDIVQQPALSPAEMMARARILRRKYKGQHVIAIADHMHRLDYPDGISADEAMGAGKATADMKNMARSDKDGGLTWFALYQPRQPADEAQQFKPVAGAHAIRGHSSVYNELDVHISPWRRIVKCTDTMRTEWGTPLAIYDKETDPMPARGTFGSDGTKIDDEHVYLTCDKHRIRGGNILQTVMLNIHAPSGFIYEHDYLRDVYRKPTDRHDDESD